MFSLVFLLTLIFKLYFDLFYSVLLAIALNDLILFFDYINVNYWDISVLILSKDTFSLCVLAPSIVRHSKILQSGDCFISFHNPCRQSVDATAGKKKKKREGTVDKAGYCEVGSSSTDATHRGDIILPGGGSCLSFHFCLGGSDGRYLSTPPYNIRMFSLYLFGKDIEMKGKSLRAWLLCSFSAGPTVSR